MVIMIITVMKHAKNVIFHVKPVFQIKYVKNVRVKIENYQIVNASKDILKIIIKNVKNVILNVISVKILLKTVLNVFREKIDIN